MKMASLGMTAAMLAIVGFAGTATAQSALKDEVRVRDGIVQVGMAYEISEKCSSLSARTFRGISYLQELKRYAQQRGYSDAQIDAYIDNKSEQRRLEAIARQQLALLGVVEGQEATYCAAGRDQIARDTRVGWLLR